MARFEFYINNVFEVCVGGLVFGEKWKKSNVGWVGVKKTKNQDGVQKPTHRWDAMIVGGLAISGQRLV